MRNYECRVCGDLCDPGELIGETCIECRKKEELETEVHDRAGKLADSPFIQIELMEALKNA